MLAEVLAAGVNAIPSVFEWTAGIALFVLVPLGFMRRTRRFAAGGLFTSAVILAMVLWISSSLVIYAYWGIAALLVATLSLGVPTVLCAFLILCMHGSWFDMFGLVAMIAASIISAVAGLTLRSLESQARHEPASEDSTI